MLASGGLMLLGLILGSIVSYATTGKPLYRPAVVGGGPVAEFANPLRVLTLNVAHGRGETWHQALVGQDAIRRNLDAVARLLDREAPHVVALQEADGPSFWSGDFDHVVYLREQCGMASQTRAKNVEGLGISYGTALLSAGALRNPLAVTFRPSAPTLSKGFVVATLEVEDPTGARREVDVVSVHIDFSRASVRRAQIDALVVRLSARDRPIIVMGDFNSGWDEGSPLRGLASRLGLHTHDAEARLVTYPAAGSRLDWILVSRELRIVSHGVLEDAVSDHRAVIAEVAFVSA